MSLKKASTSNDSPTSSDSDDASDSSSNSSSSSSSEASSAQKPQTTTTTTTTTTTKFSILKNDTDSGLRMKITAIPKSPNKKEHRTLADNTKTHQKSSIPAANTKGTHENMNHRKAKSVLSKKRQRNDSSSNSSCCSACTESDDDSDSSSFCSKEKRPSKATKPFANNNNNNKNNNNNNNNKTEKSNTNLRRNAGPSRTTINRKKPATESSGSDSDSSDDSSNSEPFEKQRTSPSKPPPLQKLKNDLSKTVPGVSNQNLNADGASSSDMELPALVRAAIQRVESCSDGENSKTEPIAGNTQYTSSLLRDFVTKSQMLGSQKIESKQTEQRLSVDKRTSTNVNQNGVPTSIDEDMEKTKKKRGRPRKQPATAATIVSPTNCNGSPDSGIISIPQSPVPSRNCTNANKKSTMSTGKKFDLATFEKNMYATERVLYPPRRKKQSIQPERGADMVPKLTLEANESKQNADKLDPVWRKIDINKKFRRPSECGYRSDTNTICSKVLAAQSGYTTDYGDINRRILSGYKSDYSCKSRRSGYKSDYSIGAKSCGYRSDCSMKHRRRIRRKRRTKTMSTKPSVTDQDILMLAGLSLGHSGDDSSSASGEKSPSTQKSQTEAQTNTIEQISNAISSSHDNGKTLQTLAKISSSQSFGRDGSRTLSNRVAKRLNSMNFDRLSPMMNSSSSSLLQITSSIYKDGDPNALVKLDGIKPGSIRRRRSSAVSHCSSHCSTNSRHPFRRRRRKRLKSTTDQTAEPNLAKLNLEIDLLSESFNSSCTIFIEKMAKEKNMPAVKAGNSKRTQKKRKINQDNSESAGSSTNPTSKRRNKKAIQTKSPDDHKLPLKKRHYLMQPGETPANKKGNHETADAKADNRQSSAENENETVGKAITPKKRHLLQTPVDLNDVIDSTDATSNSTCKDLQEIQASVSIPITNDLAANKTTSQSTKKNDVTRKKNRIEGLISKIAPAQHHSNASDSSVKICAAQKSVSSAKIQSTKSTATSKSITKSASTPKPVHTFAQIYENQSTSKGGNARATHNRNKLDTNANPPPGVFEPSIDVELAIPFTEIPIPMAQKSIDTIVNSIKIDSVNLEKVAKGDTSKITTTTTATATATPNAERLVEKLLHRTAGPIPTMAKKKRKKPNRTGFPTMKKKKKPLNKPQLAQTPINNANQSDNGLRLGSTNDSKDNQQPLGICKLNRSNNLHRNQKCSEMKAITTTTTTTTTSITSPTSITSTMTTTSTTTTTSTPLSSNKHKQTCDRVPSVGEAAGTFIERNSKPRLSVINIERLQTKSKLKTNDDKLTVAGRKKSKNDKSNKIYKQNATPCEANDDDNIDECEHNTKTDTQMPNESNGKKECTVEMKNATKQKLTKSHECDTDRKRTTTIECVGKRGVGVGGGGVGHTNDTNMNSLIITRRNRLTATNQVKHLDKRTNEQRRLTQSKAQQLVEKKSRSQPDSKFCAKANEQNKSKLKRSSAETVDLIESKIEEKKKKDSIEVKKSNLTDTKVDADQGHKRAVNGRVISSSSSASSSASSSSASSNIEQSVDEETDIMAAGEINKNGKRIRRDQESKSNDKKKSNKRIESNTDSLVIDGNDKKRPRLDSLELSTSPTARKPANATSERSIVIETVTDPSEIMPLDDWIEKITEEPLPLEENVHKFAQLTELVSINETKKSQSKPKKRYLVAGLYSNYYKEDILLHTDKATKALADKKQLITIETETQCESLLPMPYLENYVMRRRIDFCLPWDLWYAHKNGKLTGRNIVHSWNFKKIRTNIYADSVKPINQSSDLPQCSCKPEYECGDNCLNRLVYTECEPETCPCGDKCQNTKIQRHIVAQVERFMTPHKGWGVRTSLLIKRGTYILEYVGEVVPEREFKDRMATLYTNDIHHYCLHLDGGLVIDGHRMGSDCRFVNHSCEPNCEMQKWSVNGLSRMALFALRDIRPGEELTYDYNFSLFNPADGQVCKCESDQCRGVIGGKSQRVRPIEIKNSEKSNDAKKGKSKRPKRGGESKSKGFMHSKDNLRRSQIQMPTAREEYLVANGHCFLLRNLRKMRTAGAKLAAASQSNHSSQSLTAKISALRVPRNIRTRGVAIAEHDPVIEKTVRIAVILREICEELNSFKDASGQYAISKLNLPSRKKVPQYYETIKNPIDLSTIEANVEKGVYDKPTIFDDDVSRLFSNAIEYYGTESVEAVATTQLQAIYTRKKTDSFDRLVAICGESSELNKLLETQFGPFLCPVDDPNEDHIRCICGLFRDEGLMIQCSECKIWQHTECTGADTEAEHYMCEKCEPRTIDYEIPLKEDTKDGNPYYLSLMRGNLQIRQSDTVYVLRDIPIEGVATDPNDTAAKPLKHTYKTIGEIDYNECDIFRIESLWKDKDGKRFVFGHHYLRPHETFHEPTRKFYRNEVIRVPLYEQVPIELIMGRCWVMDLNTYCKGRPVDSVESHVYICELRVDKAARLFSKNSKNQYPVCTKSYAFKKFRQRIKISRNYMPHEIETTNAKQVTKKRRATDEISNQSAKRSSTPVVQLMPPPQKTMNEKRNRLEGYLSTLMTKKRTLFADAQPIDLSYLLTGRGARRRTNVPHKI